MITHNWQKLIQLQMASDLSIEDFCKSNGVSSSVFYRHKKILSEDKIAPKSKSKRIDFARVEIKDNNDKPPKGNPIHSTNGKLSSCLLPRCYPRCKLYRSQAVK